MSLDKVLAACEFLETKPSPGELTEVCGAIAALSSRLEREVALDALSTRVKGTYPKVALAKEVREQRSAEARSDEGRVEPTLVESIEPWPDPVDGAEIADEIVATMTRFAILPEHAADAIALWVFHAWALEAFQLSPILAFTAPVKASGKSSALFVASYMCPRKYISPDITNASGFRMIEKYAPTLAIDDAEKLLGRDSTLAPLLINGYLRAAAVVVRCSGDDHEPREFPVWCAKAVSLVGRLRPDTLHDRAIEIRMRPKLGHELTERRKDAKLPDELLPLRRKAMRWAEDNLDQLRDYEPALPDGLHDRAKDNWEPLLAVADHLDGAWPERGRAAAVALSTALDVAVERLPVRLLMAIRDEVLPSYVSPGELKGGEFPYDVIQSTEIIRQLLREDDSPWKELPPKGIELTGATLARLLKDFDLHPSPTKHDKARGITVRGYRIRDLEAAFERFLRKFPGNGDTPSRRATAPLAGKVSECQKANHSKVLSVDEGVRWADKPDTSGAAQKPMADGDSDTLTPPEGDAGATTDQPGSAQDSSAQLVANIARLFESNNGSLPTFRGEPCYTPRGLARALRAMPGTPWDLDARGLGGRLRQIGIRSRPSARLLLPNGTQTTKRRFYGQSDFRSPHGSTRTSRQALTAMARELKARGC